MEDDLTNGRRPQKWKITSNMEDDLKNGRQLQKWKMTSKMEDDLKNGRQLQIGSGENFGLGRKF